MAKILVVGGSLGGLFVANILLRQGHDVTLLEKTVGSLDGRGAGIVTHDALAEALRAAGVTVDETLGVPVNKRVTLGADGQSLGEMELPQVLTSWSRLYHMLKESFPSERYLQGKTVKSVTQDANAVQVLCEDGCQYDAELLIASDGIRSAVRAQVAPQIQPEYAGYIAWRGVCDEACLSSNTLDTLFNRFGFCLPNGEQMLGYPVAGSGNDTRPGKRRYNFVWYRPASEQEELVSLLTDDDGHHYPTGIPPLKVSWKHIAHMRKVAQEILAPQYAEILEKTAAPFLQAIYDVRSEQIVFGRIALMGDAAFVGRPHVGMGVTKAGDEAIVIAKHIAAHGATPAALNAYSEERLKLGQQVVARAQYLGRYMQAQGSKGNRDNEKLKRNADTVMAETAIDISDLLAQGKAVPESAH
ncbi:FAD binding domain-containing protein [Polynucleobacter sp. JS-JIR-II-50]|jgi:2-polyprenyl-6-methoxyphenol hydroxylase-like FAD-dependent oxidoreductase|uniref:FAD binding domain-containing protein n=1 Tax=Polynucleobacter sp. JS-JIR-II-50 TaxID=2576919 RepID=UPI001BFD6BEE|nr:FAD binding domain-containing protein [Polynucleobacter sp. JS-JIR-II-50]QWE05065.1 FAD-dependent monooxygenase [Polynucleobacter sp. JS-JIR-II-50]